MVNRIGFVSCLSLLFFLAACSDRVVTPGLPPVERSVSSQQTRAVHVVAVGDILLADAVQPLLDRNGYDYPFRRLASLIPKHDLLVGNLEGPITDHDIAISHRKAYVYKSDRQAAQALKDFGFHLMDLANNHTLDYGLQGLLDTQQALEAVGIDHFGAGENLDSAIRGKIVEIAGLRLGFLGFMQRWDGYINDYPFYARANRPGVPMAASPEFESAVARMRPQVDTLIINFHWGRNYADVRDTQIWWGRRAVDLGADLVIGHNSHNLQGMEVYREVPILYSLGNFTFGVEGDFEKMGDPLWHHGWIADIRFELGRAVQVDLIAIETNAKTVGYQPGPVVPSRLPAIVELVNRRFDTQLVADNRGARWSISQ